MKRLQEELDITHMRPTMKLPILTERREKEFGCEQRSFEFYKKLVDEYKERGLYKLNEAKYNRYIDNNMRDEKYNQVIVIWLMLYLDDN